MKQVYLYIHHLYQFSNIVHNILSGQYGHSHNLPRTVHSTSTSLHPYPHLQSHPLHSIISGIANSIGSHNANHNITIVRTLRERRTSSIIFPVGLVILRHVFAIAVDVFERADCTRNSEWCITDGVEIGAAVGIIPYELGPRRTVGAGSKVQGGVGGGEEGERCGYGFGMHDF